MQKLSIVNTVCYLAGFPERWLKQRGRKAWGVRLGCTEVTRGERLAAP